MTRPGSADNDSPARIGDSAISVRPNRPSAFNFRPAVDRESAEALDMPVLRPSPDGGRRPVVNPSLPLGNPVSPGSPGVDNPTSGTNRPGGWYDDAPDIYWVHFFDPSTGFYYRYPVRSFGYPWFALDRLNYFVRFYSPFSYNYFGGYYLSRCSSFISGLSSYRLNRYGYVADAALARYALGDSVLDQSVVTMAVAEADQLTASLMSQVTRLQDVLARYEAGEITRDEFREAYKQGLKFISNTAREVAQDESLGYIEQRQDIDVDNVGKVRDIKAFKLLLADMLLKVSELQARLEEMRNRQDFRAISVQEYQQTSAAELALEVEKTAKALKKSYKKI